MNWFPPILAAAALAAASVAAAMWLRRERRATDQRRFLRAMFAVCEDMFSAATPVEMLRRLQATLPRITGASTVALYLHNPVLETLDALATGTVPPQPAVPVRAAIGDRGGAIAACFRNRTMLPIAGAPPHAEPDIPGSQLLVPMLARGQAVGVLAIDRSGPARPWPPDRQAAMQHLGNQIATALKLLEQQSIRERLFRSEKLAAAGQLISGVAAELRTPLATIDAQARLCLDDSAITPSFGEALHAIVEESAKASHLVERLVSFTDLRAAQLEPVDLNTLLAGLLDFRRQEWRVRGVQCRIAAASAPVVVPGSPSQLQQALLNLLLHVEQSLPAAARTIDIAVSTLGRRALVRIVYPSGGPEPVSDSLQVVQGVLLAHGGDLHPISEGASHGFDVFLPLAEVDPVPSAGAPSGRRLTALVADPDPIARHELIRLLGQRSHRAVPCANSEEALDLIERMHFDAVLCSVRQPGANWIELRDRSSSRVDAFVLLTEGLDHDLQRAISSSAFLLQKPVGAAALDDLLSRIESRVAGR